jgi:hypothetical protein
MGCPSFIRSLCCWLPPKTKASKKGKVRNINSSMSSRASPMGSIGSQNAWNHGARARNNVQQIVYEECWGHTAQGPPWMRDGVYMPDQPRYKADARSPQYRTSSGSFWESPSPDSRAKLPGGSKVMRKTMRGNCKTA